MPPKAVIFDFGGVIVSSPFEAFARYERANALPDSFLRRLNANDPDTNAWARLERNELDAAGFAAQFEAEAEASGEADTNAGPLAEVSDYLDVVVESSKVGLRKPDTAIYELVCDELGVSPSDAVFLDDLGVNLKPARAMGMTTIKVADPDDALAELEKIVGFPLS